MSSATDQILTVLQAALIAGATVAGRRVYIDREDPLQPGEIPAIVIEDQGETIEVIDFDGMQQRVGTFDIHCVISHSTTAPADARAFGLAVETIIANSATVQALAHLGMVITSSKTNTNGDGDRLLSSRDQVWQATYQVHATAPEIINPP